VFTGSTSWRTVVARRQIAAAYVALTLLTLLLVWLDGALSLSDLVLSVVVVVLALAKSVGFVWANLRKIQQVTLEHSPFHHYLVFLVLTLSLVIYSFALDSYLLQRLVPGSYAGFSAAFTEAELLFECYYFSFLNLTIYGVVEIIPKSIPAKLLLIFQEALVFLTLVYILSDFISLRDSIRQVLSSSRDEASR